MPFIHLDYQKTQRSIVEYFHTLVAHLFYIRGCLWDWIFPSIWKSYTNTILDCLQSRKYCEAIMDDLLLFTPSKKSHMDKLEDLLRALLKNGLKISPKKCQLLRTNLQYTGNEIFIQNKRVTTFNFLSMFCPKLQDTVGGLSPPLDQQVILSSKT